MSSGYAEGREHDMPAAGEKACGRLSLHAEGAVASDSSGSGVAPAVCSSTISR